MKYDDYMDPECVALCDAINRVPGVCTNESCCGHGRGTFRVFFQSTDLRTLAILLYYVDSCHMGFRWDCTVHTDCAMRPASYYIQSEAKGKVAYEQANTIAEKINDFMDNEFDAWWKDWSDEST